MQPLTELVICGHNKQKLHVILALETVNEIKMKKKKNSWKREYPIRSETCAHK